MQEHFFGYVQLIICWCPLSGCKVEMIDLNVDAVNTHRDKPEVSHGGLISVSTSPSYRKTDMMNLSINVTVTALLLQLYRSSNLSKFAIYML